MNLHGHVAILVVSPFKGETLIGHAGDEIAKVSSKIERVWAASTPK